MFDWLVSVGVRFSSNGVVEFQRLSGAANMATATLARQRGEISRGELAMIRFRQRMDETHLSQLRLGNTVALVGAGAGAAGITYAVSQAADLQRQLTLIQIATGASNTQMDRMRSLAYEVSNATAQSVSQSAQVIGVMATSGINQIQQLNHDFVMSVAKFADVQFLKSGGKTSFDEAAKQAIQLAHLYRAYKPGEIQPILDQVTKLSFMMPDNLNRYLTQAGYYVPVFQRFGVPQEESLILGAFMDRMGLGRGKGGTALQNFLTHMTSGLQLTSHAQSGMHNALVKLGILDRDGRQNPKIFTNDKDGHSVIDIFKALQTINDSIEQQTKGLTGPERAAKERDMIGLMQHAFGVQGARFGYLGDATGIQQLLGMVQQLKKMPGVDKAQGTLMGNLTGSFQRSVSNLTSVMTELGYPWLDDLTHFFSTLADKTHGIQSWLHQHKDVDKEIGGAVAIATTLMGARAGLGTLVLAIRGLGMAADATAIRIAADDALIGGGGAAGGRGKRRAVSAAEGAAAEAAAKAEGVGIWRSIDNWVTGGLGGLAIGAATKLAGTAERVLTMPISTAMSKTGGFIERFTGAAGRMALKIGATETAATLAAGSLDALLGPLGMIASIFSVLMPSDGNYKAEAGPLMGQSADYWRKYAREHGGPASLPWTVQQGLFHRFFTSKNAYIDSNRLSQWQGTAPKTEIHVNGDIHLPNVKDPHDFIDWAQNIQRAPQAILKRSGIFTTSPTMPRALTTPVHH